MSELRRPLAFSAINTYTEGALNFFLTAILARLLSPEEIGVFLIAAGVLALTETLRDFGVGLYLVQAHEVSRDGVRTTFTVLLIMSVTLACIILFSADALASFFHEPRLVAAIRVLCVPFFIRPFINPTVALLRREMAFGYIALFDIIYGLTNVIATIVYVYLGFGYLSMAMGPVTGCIASSCSIFILRPQFWIFWPTLSEWRKVVSFGGYSSAAGFLNVLFAQLPPMVLGRVLNLDAVGLYNRSNMVSALQERAIFSVITPILLPTLAAEARRGGDLKKPYLYGLSLITAVQWPFLLCMAVMAEPAVQLFLGSKWTAAAPIVRIAALASMLGSPIVLTYPMLLAMGRVKDTLRMSIAVVPLSGLVLVASSFFGLIAVAASQFITIPIQVFVSVALIRRTLPLGWTDIVSSTAKSATISACAIAVPLLVVMLFGLRFDLPYAAIGIAAIGAVAGWYFGLVLTDHPLLLEMRRFLGLAPTPIAGAASEAAP
jgi:O-antigen/teichoic acid export membrane protein